MKRSSYRTNLVAYATLILSMLISAKAMIIATDSNGDITDPAIWADDASPIAGNDYVINGHIIGTPTDGIVTFAGDSLSVANGGQITQSGVRPGMLEFDFTQANSRLILNAGQLSFGGSNQYNRNINFNTDLEVGGGLVNTIHGFNNNFNISIGFQGLTGAGNLEVTQGNNARPVLSFSQTSLSPFTGTITMPGTKAQLIANAANALGDGRFILNSNSTILFNADHLSAYSAIDMGTDASFTWGGNSIQLGSLSIDGNIIGPGTYSQMDLENLGYGGTFEGSSSISVVPEPSSAGLTALGLLMLVGIRRRR